MNHKEYLYESVFFLVMKCCVITICGTWQLNAAYCDEVVRIEEKVAQVKEERRQVVLFYTVQHKAYAYNNIKLAYCQTGGIS